MVDTFTVTSVEPNQQYELRLATYSNRGISPMSNSIEIATPSGTVLSTETIADE